MRNLTQAEIEIISGGAFQYPNPLKANEIDDIFCPVGPKPIPKPIPDRGIFPPDI